MHAPSNGPPTRMFAPTMSPIAKGAILLTAPLLGSIAVPYTVYISPNVMIISSISMCPTPTPCPTWNPDGLYNKRPKTTQSVFIEISFFSSNGKKCPWKDGRTLVK